MPPEPSTSHVAYGYQDDLAYDRGDYKRGGWADGVEDRADGRPDE